MQSSSQIVTINKPTPSFLQAGNPSCRPTSSVKALRDNLLAVTCSYPSLWASVLTMNISTSSLASQSNLWRRKITTDRGVWPLLSCFGCDFLSRVTVPSVWPSSVYDCRCYLDTSYVGFLLPTWPFYFSGETYFPKNSLLIMCPENPNCSLISHSSVNYLFRWTLRIINYSRQLCLFWLLCLCFSRDLFFYVFCGR